VKRLAILLFCSSAYALDIPMAEECNDVRCVIEKPKLQAMYQGFQVMKEQRDEALEAYMAMRAKLNTMQPQLCGVFS
jgi:hypothetical protein